MYWGAKYAGCVSLITKGIGGVPSLRVPTPAVRIQLVLLRVPCPAPGHCGASAHSTIAWCTSVLASPGMSDPFCFALCVTVTNHVCLVSLLSHQYWSHAAVNTTTHQPLSPTTHTCFCTWSLSTLTSSSTSLILFLLSCS